MSRSSGPPRVETGTNTYTDWEWLVARFVGLSRRAGESVAFDAAWVASQLPQLIEGDQEVIRVEQAHCSVVIASPDGLDTAQSAAPAPAPTAPPSPAAEDEQEHQSH